ncbi:MAG: creatininase family protein [Halobacteriales archaeon]|nr:creatininase family protein [Halobacteriales archaeon]
MRTEFEPFDLGAKTADDAGSAIETADFVALPCGSFEQHSDHLPLLTDSIEADHLAGEIARRAEAFDIEIAVLPTLPYGYSEHHMNFPGTVTLDADTYQQVIEQIGASMAAHDADRLLIVNHHGGNREPLKLAADRLQRDHELPTHVILPPFMEFARDRLNEHFGEGWGHAGDYETSVIEHYHPELVKSEAKEDQILKRSFETRSPVYFDEMTEQGGLGDPTNADPAFIAEFIEEMVDGILTRLEEDM